MANYAVSALRRVGALGLGLSVATVALCSVPTPGPGRPAPLPRPAAPSTSLTATLWGDLTADLTALDNAGHNDPSADQGSLYTITSAIGARNVWKQQDNHGRQITGQGVTVALLDSGTAAAPGLTGAGKLSYGPDLSIESNGGLTDQDTYGHGTHMAGIIAANDGVTNTRHPLPKCHPAPSSASLRTRTWNR